MMADQRWEWRRPDEAPQDGTQIIACWHNSKGEAKLSIVRFMDGRWRAGLTKDGEAIYIPNLVLWTEAPCVPVIR